jgi:hypothetical protein
MAINKGFRRHGPRGTARMAISLKRRPRRRLRGFTTTCSPLARVGTASRLISDGVGFVNPFAALRLRRVLRDPLGSVGSSTQLHLILRPVLKSR